MWFMKWVLGIIMLGLGAIGVLGGVLGGGWSWLIPGVILIVVGWVTSSRGSNRIARKVDRTQRVQRIERGIWDQKLDNEAAEEAIRRELKRRGYEQ